ncbi:hypothetical protein ACTA71_001485 [Dictyostelium dimigraforme]
MVLFNSNLCPRFNMCLYCGCYTVASGHLLHQLIPYQKLHQLGKLQMVLTFLFHRVYSTSSAVTNSTITGVSVTIAASISCSRRLYVNRNPFCHQTYLTNSCILYLRFIALFPTLLYNSDDFANLRYHPCRFVQC